MAQTTTHGLKVWNLSTDAYNHNDLVTNWNLVETLFGSSGKSLQSINNLTAGSANGPQTPLAAGDVAITTTTVENFPPYTLILYNGTDWVTVGHVEVSATLPTLHLYDGRFVLLTASVSNFQAYSLVRYKSSGATWDYVGPFQLGFTGTGSMSNVNGAQINGDVYVTSGNRGLILTDRTTSTKFRVYMDNSILKFETVT